VQTFGGADEAQVPRHLHENPELAESDGFHSAFLNQKPTIGEFT
jgi:hypothetical protein